MLRVVSGETHVFLGRFLETDPFLPRQRADHFGRRTQHQGTGRNLSARRDQSACADERLLADHGAVKNGRSHANQNLIANRAGVNDGDMANSDVIAYDAGEIVRQMQDGIVLDVCMVADNNAVEVTPEHGVVPDAGVMTERDVAQHHRAPGNINAFAQGWLLQKESVELPFH